MNYISNQKQPNIIHLVLRKKINESPSTTTINALPHIIMLQIFSNLEIKDVKKCKLVNKKFSKVLKNKNNSTFLLNYLWKKTILLEEHTWNKYIEGSKTAPIFFQKYRIYFRIALSFFR